MDDRGQRAQQQIPQPSTPPPRQHWRVLLWVLVAVLASAYFVGATRGSPVEEISYTQFKQEVRADDVKSVEIRGDQVTGRYRPEAVEQAAQKAAGARDAGKQQQGGGKAGAAPEQSGTAAAPAPSRFVTVLPPVDDPDLMPLLEKHGVTVSAQSTQASWWVELLATLLPWMLILGLFLYLGYRMQQRMMAGGGLFSFGKSRATRHREESTGVGFDDVAGLENAKSDLGEIVQYLEKPEHYRAIGAKIPRGLLLMGPPGTGKTLLARAVAGEADVPFYSISGSEFIEMFVGVGASRVRDMFKSAKQDGAAIIFIDEIDSVGRTRGAGIGGGHDEREQTLNQILSEMDGFTPHETVIVLAATNRPDVLDPALTRPGRFDRKVVLDLPHRDARRRILEVHARDVPLAEDVDLDNLAARTVGFSGADLENLVNEAALLAGRRNRERVDMSTFADARDRILLGEVREDALGDAEKEVVAFHESGHALMAWLLPEADPLDKVTIIPRGRALGATEQTPGEERRNLRRSYLRDRIGVMLGGRVAEQLVFGDVTTGAESDLEQATRLARRMICQWGMSEKLGPAVFRRGGEHVFLGREMAQQQDFSEATARLIDDEIRALLNAVEDEVRALMQSHRGALDALARALIEHETVEAAEAQRLFARAGRAAAQPEEAGAQN